MKNSDSLREIAKVSLMITLAYYFEKISRPTAWGGGIPRWIPVYFLSREDAVESVESRAARVPKRKVPRENLDDLPRFPCSPPS